MGPRDLGDLVRLGGNFYTDAVFAVVIFVAAAVNIVFAVRLLASDPAGSLFVWALGILAIGSGLYLSRETDRICLESGKDTSVVIIQRKFLFQRISTLRYGAAEVRFIRLIDRHQRPRRVILRAPDKQRFIVKKMATPAWVDRFRARLGELAPDLKWKWAKGSWEAEVGHPSIHGSDQG